VIFGSPFRCPALASVSLSGDSGAVSVICGFQTERAVEVVKLPARRSREFDKNDITRDASAAAFDPLVTPFFPHRPDEGGRGYLPTLGQPAWGGGYPYLPTQNAAPPPYPTPQKSQIQ
jgi:hypothetical protein